MATIIYYHDEQLEVISTRFSKYKLWKFGLPQIFGLFLSIFNHKINVKSVTVTFLFDQNGKRSFWTGPQIINMSCFFIREPKIAHIALKFNLH